MIALLLVAAFAKESKVETVKTLIDKYETLRPAPHADYHDAIIEVFQAEIEILRARNAYLEKELETLRKEHSACVQTK
jgi:hypothetical protein